jgi:hypothetical protein
MASKKAGAKGKKFELTEEQKQEIREAFDLFDTDGSGRLTVRLFVIYDNYEYICFMFRATSELCVALASVIFCHIHTRRPFETGT